MQPTVTFADEAVKPQLAKGKPPAAKVCEKAMVPCQTWPRYPCKENGGAGWTVEITSKQKDRVRVRFTDARDRRGALWCEEWMRAETLVPLPSDQNGIVPSKMSRAQVSSHAIAFADQQVAAGLVRAALEGMENEKSNTIALEPQPDDEIMNMTTCQPAWTTGQKI